MMRRGPAVILLVALCACDRGGAVASDAAPDGWPEYHIPLDIDVEVNPDNAWIYLNASDAVVPSEGRNEFFPAIGSCVGIGDGSILGTSCVRSAAFVGGGERQELPLDNIGGPLPITLPDDFALEIEGCDTEPVRVPIRAAGTSTIRVTLDVQTDADGEHVSWTSDGPWHSALVAQSNGLGGGRCHTLESTYTFGHVAPYVSVGLLDVPIVTTGSWGTARVWTFRGGGAMQVDR